MLDFNFRVDGLKELAAALEGLPAGVRRPVLLAALKKAGVPMVALMGTLAPRSNRGFEGDRDAVLADAMKVSEARRVEGRFLDRDTEAAVAVGPSKNAFWGLFQEYGTVFHGPQPFARPAFDGTYEQALQILKDEGWRGIRSQVPTAPGGAL